MDKVERSRPSSRIRRCARRGLLALLVGAAAIACSATSTADGYLYASAGEAVFVRWAGGEAEAGDIDWRLAPDQRRTGDFTVKRTQGGFEFVFEPGTLAGWTGRFDGDAIVLTIPDSAGQLRTLSFRPATTSEFEQASSDLE